MGHEGAKAEVESNSGLRSPRVGRTSLEADLGPDPVDPWQVGEFSGFRFD